MATTLPAFTPLEDSLWLTLCCRALDNRRSDPILDLGFGLDSRVQRLAAPPSVDWYDVDFPAVATARRSVVPEHPNHVIGADVRDRTGCTQSPATGWR